MLAADVWGELVRMLHTTRRPSNRVSTSLIGISQQRPALMEIIDRCGGQVRRRHPATAERPVGGPLRGGASSVAATDAARCR